MEGMTDGLGCAIAMIGGVVGVICLGFGIALGIALCKGTITVSGLAIVISGLALLVIAFLVGLRSR